VRIIDTVLSCRPVPANELQLLAIAALLIAAKLEEYYPPTVE